MLAYEFAYHVDASRTVNIELPADAPTGLAQIIVLFPDAPLHDAIDPPHDAVVTEKNGEKIDTDR